MLILNKSNKEEYFFKDCLIFIFAMLGPLSTTFLDKINLRIIFFIICSYLLLFLLNKKKLSIAVGAKTIILPYILCFFIASISSLISIPSLGSDYLGEFLSRLVTVANGMLIMLLLFDWSNRSSFDKNKVFLLFSFFSTIIFLIFAVYQVAAFKLGLPFMETRAHVPGADYSIQQVIGQRVTSIAREPNFYSPILFESLILAYVILPKRLLYLFSIITFFIMLKTFSTGVYLHFFLFFAFLLFQKSKSILLNFFIGTLMFIVAVNAVIFFFSDTSMYEYFISKLNRELSGESYRSYIMSSIYSAWLSSDANNILFGFGVSTLVYINELSPLISNSKFGISNSFFLDFLWDSGVVGLVCILVGWFTFFIRLYKVRNINIYYRCSLLMFFSFMLTSLYRSEYTTTHFFWVLVNVIVLYNLALKSKNIKEKF